MRVAYRESIGEDLDIDLVLDKKIGKQSLYAKLCLRLESTLEDIDVTELQKQRFDEGSAEDQEGQNQASYSIQDGNDGGQSQSGETNFAKN